MLVLLLAAVKRSKKAIDLPSDRRLTGGFAVSANMA